eukprot:gene7411-15139_t
MEELATNNIFHKDMSARNILAFPFDALASERILVKVSDFVESTALPIRWMAPESVKKHKFSEKSDVYSYGVLVWELLSGGQVPWGLAVSEIEVQTRVMDGNTLPYQSHWCLMLVDVMSQCWKTSPQDRPTFKK